MNKTLEALIIIGLIITAVITAWSVLSANHLNIG
ncbi:hypothetical protein [Campylobacter sp.]|nr:hypothetical protein [Campylobacter sp.]MDO4674227.1 hypothetical protein [Campylobacter sp.]